MTSIRPTQSNAFSTSKTKSRSRGECRNLSEANRFRRP